MDHFLSIYVVLFYFVEILKALAKLDYYPQKYAFFTGSQWINIKQYLQHRPKQKLDQMQSLFSIPEVEFNEVTTEVVRKRYANVLSN